MDIDIRKLFDLIADRLNNPVNMQLNIRAVVKDIPDSIHGTLTTLVVYNTSEESKEDGSASIDNRIIDDFDLHEQEIITEDEESDIDASPSDLTKMIKLLTEVKEKRGPYSRDHLTHAENCINYMSEKAEACLKILHKKKYATKPHFPSR